MVTVAAGIDPAATGVLVTPDFSGDPTNTNSQAVVEWRSSGSACPGATIEIRTYNETVTDGVLTLILTNEAFFFAVP